MIVHTPIVMDYIIPIRRKATARKSDPQVSHDAAARVELGKAERQRRLIYLSLKNYGPQTVKELASRPVYIWGIDVSAHELGKRIGEVKGIAPTGEKRGGMRVWSLYAIPALRTPPNPKRQPYAGDRAGVLSQDVSPCQVSPIPQIGGHPCKTR